ncbi:MAG: ABC transporter ATP-binding protein [Chlamydiales bacterium]
MKLLLKSALLNRKHYALLLVTILAMFMLTIGSQMEMFALGVITKMGPDFFTLFGTEKEGRLQQANSVTLDQVESKWGVIASTPRGPISIDAANAYISHRGGMTIVQRLVAFLDRHFDIHRHLVHLAFILIFVAFFKATALFFHRYLTQLISIRVSRDLRQQYFEHIQSLPMKFYHDYDIGSLSARVSGDAGVVASAINSLLLNYIQAPFAVISTLFACFYISWKLSVVIFIGFPIIVLPIIYIAKKIKAISKQMQRNQEGFAAVLLDFLSGVMTIKVFAMESFSLKKYKEQNNKMAYLEECSARFGTAARPLLHTISSLFFALVILFGLYFFHLAAAELFVFCGLLYVFYEPIKKFAEENNNIFRGIAASERMYEVLNIDSAIQDEPDAMNFIELKELIEFRNVSFRYRDEWIIKNVSFTIKKGETVALLGPTGAGKSTLVKLLPRLYDIQEGDILIDGRSIKKYTQKSLREGIAFIPQKPFLFFDTIRANIAFGQNFTDQEIRAAARSAHAEEFIVQLPNSFDFQLEESGKNLSGGQQQRIAIARALVKNAPILVMDEATSSLDVVSEGRIRDAICNLHGKLTQIIIAHRFSTIEHADKIVYLENGTKIGEGSKEELIKNCPSFHRMYSLWHKQGTGLE